MVKGFRFARHLTQAIALLSFLAIPTAVNAEPVVIPGTSVAIEAPTGFTISDTFTGLENAETRSSITVNELPPEAYSDILTLFTSFETATEAWASRGITIDQLTWLTVNDGEVPLLTGKQVMGGVEVTKYIALLEGENTVLVTFNIVEPSPITQDDAQMVVESISLLSALTLDEKVAQLSFSFEAIDPFQVAHVFAGNTVSLQTTEGPDPSGMAPVVIITRAHSITATSDPSQIGEQLLRSTPDFQAVEITEQDSASFAGGTGHFISGMAGDRTAVQFLHIPADGRYIRLVAMGETDALEDLISTVQDIADSVEILD